MTTVRADRLDEPSTDEAAVAGTLAGASSWWQIPTPLGCFELAAVRPAADLPLLHDWMNDPAVDAFWRLAGEPGITAGHLARLAATPTATPYLGWLGGTPMSYWEIYRADLDVVADHVTVRPHDTGLHLMIGPASRRGRGLGTRLLRAVTGWIFSHDPWTERVLAEPDVHDAASIRAFRKAGFAPLGVVNLAERDAVLLAREREPATELDP